MEPPTSLAPITWYPTCLNKIKVCTEEVDVDGAPHVVGAHHMVSHVPEQDQSMHRRGETLDSGHRWSHPNLCCPSHGIPHVKLDGWIPHIY